MTDRLKKYSGMKVELRTGTSFSYPKWGDKDYSFSPTFWDVVHVFRVLYDRGYGSQVLPDRMPAEHLLNPDEGHVHSVVPWVIGGIDVLLQNFIPQERGPDEEFDICSVAWVLAWYWHKKLGGPRPYRNAPIRLEPVRSIEKPNCPWCNKLYQPPSNYRNRGAIARHWGKWIKKHLDEECFTTNPPGG